MLHKYIFSQIFIVLLSLVVNSQSTPTLGDKLNLAIKKDLPELKVLEPIKLVSRYQTTSQEITSKWKTKNDRTVSIDIQIVGYLNEKDKNEDFRHYVFRNSIPPNRLIEGISDKAILVSRADTVEVRFFKENLLVDINFEFPAKRKVGFYGPAPQKEEEHAIKIAQVVDKLIDGKRTLSPCYNDFQKPPISAEKTPEDNLIAAIINAEVEQVKKLTNQNINFNAVLPYFPHLSSYEYDGNKILHIAAKQGCAEIVKILLDNKADINVKNLHNETPLMLAVQYEHLEATKVLLESGADVNIKSKNGRNAAFYAFALLSPYSSITPFQPRIELLKLLSKYGLDLKEKDGENASNLLMYLPCGIKDWCFEITSFLLKEGLAINEPNKKGETVLIKVAYHALSNDYWRFPDHAIATFKLLIANGADVNYRYQNQTILEILNEKKKTTHPSNKEILLRIDEMIKLLIEAGAK